MAEARLHADVLSIEALAEKVLVVVDGESGRFSN